MEVLVAGEPAVGSLVGLPVESVGLGVVQVIPPVPLVGQVLVRPGAVVVVLECCLVVVVALLAALRSPLRLPAMVQCQVLP